MDCEIYKSNFVWLRISTILVLITLIIGHTTNIVCFLISVYLCKKCNLMYFYITH